MLNFSKAILFFITFSLFFTVIYPKHKHTDRSKINKKNNKTALYSNKENYSEQLPITPKKNLRTSIIIPCHIKHLQHLPNLLQTYTHQTRLPDEIVISISETTNESFFIIKKIKEYILPFKLIIISSSETLYAGQNRNIACSNATGDIFICQDADDIPHPQRTEIITYFFEHHNIDHLTHTYILQPKQQTITFPHYSVNKIKYFNPEQLVTCKHIEITNGNASISRALFQDYKWPDDKKGEDIKFNNMVYKKYKNRLVLNVPLISYRMYLSSNEEHCLIAHRLAQ